MNRLFRAIFAVILVGIITFCAISITQNLGRSLQWDLTEEKIYSLSDGTKNILNKINQPIDIKLYYAKTASLKAPDMIKDFNDYYFFVKALLEEYADYAGKMINLQVIDPRPFSEEEQEALRYGLKRYQITADEGFFFGLVAQTQYGAVKTIDIFDPKRQSSVEYDISYLLDSLISREKKKIGVLSSLPVMGDDMSGYMAQMMRIRGQQPRGPWIIIRQLQQQYDVTKIDTDTEQIKDVDILLVIHPKNLPDKTLFAIDQFVLRGGRTIVCVDPHCFADRVSPQMQMSGQMPPQNSDLNQLLENWGVRMIPNALAGDMELALSIPSQGPTGRPEQLIGLLELKSPDCFNNDNVITAQMNQLRVLYSGVLEKYEVKEHISYSALDPCKPKLTDKETEAENLQFHFEPLLTTTAEGNTWQASSPMELNPPYWNPKRLLEKFTPGTKPLTLACMLSGRFPSAFPKGIDVKEDKDKKEKAAEDKNASDEKDKDKYALKRTPTDDPNVFHLTGLECPPPGTECTVAVLADVDFLSDNLAYQQGFFGTTAAGDNSALLLNTIETFSGSGDLIAIRSRGNFKRPFTRVEDIEKKAEEKTADEEAAINAEIQKTQNELNEIINEHKNKGQMLIDASELNEATAKLQLKISEAKKKLFDAQKTRREDTEKLENKLRNINTLSASAAILVIAIILSARRNLLRRRYISHVSDA